MARHKSIARSTQLPSEKLLPIIDYTWQDWESFIDYVSQPIPKHLEPASHVRGLGVFKGEQGESDDFYGPSLKDTVELARNGWLEKVEASRKIVDVISDQITSMIERVDVSYDVIGIDVDPSRLASGEPECCIVPVITQVEGSGHRIIKLGVNCVYSGSFGAESIINHGSLVVALIECLELAGYRVEVTACFPFSYPGGHYYHAREAIVDARILVKPAEQPIDLGRILFAFAHPAMLRRLGFRLQSFMPVEYQTAMSASGGGVCEEPDCQTKDFDIYIGGRLSLNEQWLESNGVEWVLKKLKAQGIDITTKD